MSALATDGVNTILTPLIAQIGLGGIGGLLVGYAFKKLLKIVAVILGIFIFGLFLLAYEGVININYDKFLEFLGGLVGLAPIIQELILAIAASLPFAASFTLGFFLGFKRG
jgi:uncharacterized membrane protein (Fun14 family)